MLSSLITLIILCVGAFASSAFSIATKALNNMNMRLSYIVGGGIRRRRCMSLADAFPYGDVPSSSTTEQPYTWDVKHSLHRHSRRILEEFDRCSSCLCIFMAVRDVGVVHCACLDWRRSAHNLTFSTSALLCSWRRIQPHHFTDIFSMKIWMQPRYVLQWMAILWLIKQAADEHHGICVRCPRQALGSHQNWWTLSCMTDWIVSFLLFPRAMRVAFVMDSWWDLQPKCDETCNQQPQNVAARGIFFRLLASPELGAKKKKEKEEESSSCSPMHQLHQSYRRMQRRIVTRGDYYTYEQANSILLGLRFKQSRWDDHA